MSRRGRGESAWFADKIDRSAHFLENPTSCVDRPPTAIRASLGRGRGARLTQEEIHLHAMQRRQKADGWCDSRNSLVNATWERREAIGFMKAHEALGEEVGDLA
jgi:hypothetical protein